MVVVLVDDTGRRDVVVVVVPVEVGAGVFQPDLARLERVESEVLIVLMASRARSTGRTSSSSSSSAGCSRVTTFVVPRETEAVVAEVVAVLLEERDDDPAVALAPEMETEAAEGVGVVVDLRPRDDDDEVVVGGTRLVVVAVVGLAGCFVLEVEEIDKLFPKSSAS